MLVNEVIDRIIEVEGGYVNNPNDSGGETNYGITKAVARKYGYSGSMRDMPRSIAFDILKGEYWDILNLDQVAARSPGVAEELADTAVNMGVHRAGTFLQRALNVLNIKEKLYSDLTIDGQVGPKTIQAYNKFIDHRGTKGITVLLRALNSLQGAFYIRLAERREKDEEFLTGWLLNRVT